VYNAFCWSHSGTAVPECTLRTTAKVNGKVGNSTPANRKTPEPIVTKFCMGDYVETLTTMQNFVTIRLPVFVPEMCENSHQVTRLGFFGYFRQRTAKIPAPIFFDPYVKWRRFAQRYGFWRFRKQNFIFLPHFFQKRKVLTYFWRGWKIP